jgi:hypothetical protein
MIACWNSQTTIAYLNGRDSCYWLSYEHATYSCCSAHLNEANPSFLDAKSNLSRDPAKALVRFGITRKREKEEIS